MEYENKHGASGTAKAGLTLGIIGSALGALNNGVLGGVVGGGCNNDHYINRYEAEQSAKLADAESKIRLLEGNIYTDSKIADVYERLNTKIGVVESQLCRQSVVNAEVTANLACLQNTVATLSGLTKTVIPITSICPEPAPATTTGA